MSKLFIRILLGLLAIVLLLAGFVVIIATTPWGQQMVKDGERSKAMQDIMGKVGWTDSLGRLINGKGRGWRGRTGGLALSVLATAAAVASMAPKEEER